MCSYWESCESLVDFFCEVDLVIMLLWIEGFGFVVFEVFFVGFLILVSDNSGFG